MANAPAGKGGREAPLCPTNGVVILPEEGEDSLLRLAGEGQGLDAQLLAGLQGEQVGAFLVAVGQGQLAGARLQASVSGTAETRRGQRRNMYRSSRTPARSSPRLWARTALRARRRQSPRMWAEESMKENVGMARLPGKLCRSVRHGARRRKPPPVPPAPVVNAPVAGRVPDGEAPMGAARTVVSRAGAGITRQIQRNFR